MRSIIIRSFDASVTTYVLSLYLYVKTRCSDGKKRLMSTSNLVPRTYHALVKIDCCTLRQAGQDLALSQPHHAHSAHAREGDREWGGGGGGGDVWLGWGGGGRVLNQPFHVRPSQINNLKIGPLFVLLLLLLLLLSALIPRVPDQNGVSLLYSMLEIHRSGREPSIYKDLNYIPVILDECLGHYS